MRPAFPKAHRLYGERVISKTKLELRKERSDKFGVGNQCPLEINFWIRSSPVQDNCKTMSFILLSYWKKTLKWLQEYINYNKVKYEWRKKDGKRWNKGQAHCIKLVQYDLVHLPQVGCEFNSELPTCQLKEKNVLSNCINCISFVYKW